MTYRPVSSPGQFPASELENKYKGGIEAVGKLTDLLRDVRPWDKEEVLRESGYQFENRDGTLMVFFGCDVAPELDFWYEVKD